ncbi:MAG: amidase [Fimbriimonas sp.]|nr:amidase [Fimbriimonas sp.]
MAIDQGLTRKDMLRTMLVAAAGAALPIQAMAGTTQSPATDITLDDLKSMEKIAGISFSDDERKKVLAEIRGARAGYAGIRKLPIGPTVEPSTTFHPLGGGSVPNARVRARHSNPRVKRPFTDVDIAFLSLRELATLVRTQQVSPVELTQIYLNRLKTYGDRLLCVVTLTESLALEQAARAEREIRSGHYRGPLHGIPYGIKDLFSTKGITTTWGADPFAHQVFDIDATVVRKLDEAGAILLAKLSCGALAQGDVWFRGTTKNPWNPKQGSSGSSAGSASSTAAGLVGFSIGTETYGSITSPSMRCRVTGFRPTYGRVSRYGAMGLSYTMDKVGPICREVEDCALVFAAMCGADPMDAASVDRAFDYPKRIDISKLKVGYVGSQTAMDADPAVAAFKTAGAQVRRVTFSPMPDGVNQILDVEAGSAFDAFTLGKEIHELKNSTWPETFRASRYVPAVEYLQAQRARTLLMHGFEAELGDLDCVLGSGVLGQILGHCNYCGHPQIALPFGDDGKGNSVSRSLVGRLYRDDELLAIAKWLQDHFDFHRRRPDLSKV